MSDDDKALMCIQVVEMVTAYVEGDLDAEAARRFDEHLAVCPPCEVYVQQMRDVIEELGGVPVDQISDHARDDLLRAFRDLHMPTS
jgi:anti-sigma factor RsiW